MDTLMKDVGYAARTLGKSPGFTAIAVLTLAVGIGACTAIFSVVNAVLLRPLPYSDAGRLVIVWGEMRTRSVNDWPFSPPDFRDLRQHSTLFEDMAASTPGGRVPIGGDDAAPEQVRVAGTTPNLFAILGAKIAIGRDFNESDAQPQVQPPANPGAAPGPPPPQLPASVMLSHELWQRRYGGDPRVVGRMIDFGNGRADRRRART
jgi:putative ABC transport system permease protein